MNRRWTDLAVDALCAYRLTRLVTADTITQPLRDRVITWGYLHDEHTRRAMDAREAAYGLRHGDCEAMQRLAMEDDCPPRVAELVTCRWCASVWIGVAVVAARALCPRVWDPIARAGALSAVAVLTARLEDG